MSSPATEYCSLCSSDLAGSDDPCPACRTRSHSLDGLKAAGPWAGLLREWLSSLKYGGDSRLAGYLADLLLARWKEEWSGIPIVPVPPRLKRLFQTGTDPVGMICDGIRAGGAPVERLLVRRGGRPQKTLSREERLSGTALHISLRWPNRLIGGNYVVLDDVTTTGATLNICADLLKSNGASRVYGLVVCRD